MIQMMNNAVFQIFKTAPEFADVANSRVLNSKPPVTSSSSQVRPQRSSAPLPPPPGSQVNSSGAASSGSTIADNSSSQDSASTHPNSSMTTSALVNSNNSSSSVYFSPLPDAGGTTYSQTRAKLRPTTTFGTMGQFLPGWIENWFFKLRFTLIILLIVDKQLQCESLNDENG